MTSRSRFMEVVGVGGGGGVFALGNVGAMPSSTIP